MTDKRTDKELSRAVADKLGWDDESKNWMLASDELPSPPDYATDWSLIGPEIEGRYHDYNFRHALKMHILCGAGTLPRAACLAILEE